MKAAFLSLVTIAFAGSLAQATSVIYIPHRPELVCGNVRELINHLNAGRLENSTEWFVPTFYSDRFGKVEASEEVEFLHSLHNANGKPDAKPLKLDGVYKIASDDDSGIYLVRLVRMSWKLERHEKDAISGTKRVPGPHYEKEDWYWIANYRYQGLTDFREAGELYPLATELKKMESCE